ncbi:ribonucleases P/MRP protein subunit POP1 [Venturia canescens]|uniref:ribonucleases P/MRP protein subunit POP1 n=1 Tax=Venturia canescens TaxID=32260 RepID=UPI001C9D61C7|nr:ribonucleases P/MRP protein subunit POP1 [Venturia canescens]
MEKKQFDEFLGGRVELPREVQIVRLTSARATEIAAMAYSIENPQQSKLVFQKLAVHMRRRVMSHNAKRMPRRLREVHLRQMTKSGLPPKSKRPSRKYRRRALNLTEEYNRRKLLCKWLETHLWHAKRFKMLEKWGYKIGETPNDKSFRACYRAASEHCLLQDISYYNCLEIQGPRDILEKTLTAHCNPGKLTFAAKIYRAGNREGSVMFFKRNKYPESPIGHFKFLWKPGDTPHRTIWIWIHPLVYKEAVEEIVKSFKFNPTSKTEASATTEKSSVTYENDDNCRMTDLRDALNRFRLTGPLALAILTDALRLPNLIPKLNIATQNVDKSLDESPTSWLENFYQDPSNLQSFYVQKELIDALKTLKSPSQLPPNSVIAMTVLDPRFFLPHKRTKKLSNSSRYYEKIEYPRDLAERSPLWDPATRKLILESRKSTADINKLRSENLVPGISNDHEFDEKIITKIPVIIVQNPGCNNGRTRIGFTSGIDIIIPSGWSMPFWQSFILRCARAGGLKESRLLAFERAEVDSPEIHQPDIPSYAREALTTMNQLRTKYFRYPPNRRVNFTKFAITSPFYCEWSILMKEWTNSEKFNVLRDRALLEILVKSFSRFPVRGKTKNLNGQKSFVSTPESTSQVLDRALFAHSNWLVPVKLTLRGKGRARNFAIICTPSSEDLEALRKNKNWSGPVQKLMPDHNKQERNTLRKSHKKILKRSNRRRNRCETLAQGAANAFNLKKRQNKSGISIEKNFSLKKKYQEKMEELYLPKCEKVRNSCDRQIMGYVIQGDFSFNDARGTGIGYVTLNSLWNIIDLRIDDVLVRNTQTRQYRFARIEVLNHR